MSWGMHAGGPRPVGAEAVALALILAAVQATRDDAAADHMAIAWTIAMDPDPHAGSARGVLRKIRGEIEATIGRLDCAAAAILLYQATGVSWGEVPPC